LVGNSKHRFKLYALFMPGIATYLVHFQIITLVLPSPSALSQRERGLFSPRMRGELEGGFSKKIP